MEYLHKLNNFFEVEIWEADLKGLSPTRALLIKSLRLVYGTYKEFKNNELDMRAMGLVYSTLLALVPLLALSFSILKAFGVHNQLRDALENFLLPLGEKGPEIAQRIIEFVDNIKIGVLSAVGLGLLIYTVIRLIQKIEDSVNYIWKIEKSRSLARRFSDYMSIVLTGPVLVFLALSLKAVFMSHQLIQRIINIEPFEIVFVVLGQILPFLFICLAFTFVIIFIPNTKVNFKSALLGGLISATGWVVAAWVFSSFVVTSARYIAIYSSFAVLFLFILWLYFNWLIILLGSQVAYCHQNLDTLSLRRELKEMSNRLKEKLCLYILYLVGRNFVQGGERLTAGEISTRLAQPLNSVTELLSLLESKDLVHQTNDEPAYYMPSRHPKTIRLAEVLTSIRGENYDARGAINTLDGGELIDRLMERVEEAMERTLDGETLEDLIAKGAKPPGEEEKGEHR